MTSIAPTLAERVADVRLRIDRAAEQAGRSSGGITLIAVSKTFDDDAVRNARDLGLIDFGESRAQALGARRQNNPPPPVRSHPLGRPPHQKDEPVCR
ncbi:MAG: YggS family pyridoxal phosphate-dependent enzyme, partial [Euzebya sp.]